DRPTGAYAAIALTVILWSSAFPAIRAALDGFGPAELAAGRYLVASAAFAAYALATRMPLPARSDWPRIALVGALGIAAYNLLLNAGEVTVAAGTAALIINTVPVFAALLSTLLLGERLRGWGWAGIALSFAGVAVIALGRGDGPQIDRGALLLLAAALAQAAQFVLQKPLAARHGALPGAPRVPGGSSSGAAVSVATGAAFVGLGSDTGGSIRIPAALNGLVGFKNTARLVPTTGAVPLSTTLDTACAMTRSVRDALLVHEILAARRVTRSPAPLSAWRLAVPTTTFLDGMEPAVATAFGRTLQALRGAGARITEIALPELADLAHINATGGFSATESYAWHRPLLATQAHRYDPRVRSRIERGAGMSAADYIDLLHARRAWISRMEAALAGFDALLSPTVPIVAPTIASVAPADGTDPAQDAARDAEFFRANGLLLRNTSVVNMLDGCALSLPCHAAGELPVGLMVWHAALHDDPVLNIGLRIEEALQKQ
ncbi:MAG: EamA family transporter, partial [Burkholderiaceae bacterium]